ncbi:Cell wall beta-glucan synthesis [Penicillium expansum]|nr:Cell wall beta-glucan synthesis [Penicillium expansum]
MRFSIATAFSALVALSVAYTTPDYTKDPSGNAISSPGLNEIVPEGKTYTIKWTPTTVGPISLVLLRGPSTNVVPLKTLAESIPNSGEFKWTPGSDLTADTTHYGLLLVVEGTGQYQYSTQFGISAAAGSVSISSSSSSTVEATETETSAAASAPAASSTVIESTVITTTICPETETTAAAITSAPKVIPTAPPPAPPLSSVRLTTSAIPTGTASASASASSPVFNSAGRNAASFGVVMAGVLAAFAL